MKKISASYMAVTIVLAGLISFTMTSETAIASSILYVGGTGPGNYTTIQSAIDDATSGDTIFVYNGTYFENLIVNKQLTIMGENKINTVIDAQEAGNVIDITIDNVIITDFTITNSTEDSPNCIGVNIISADFCKISNNIFTKNWYSVFLDQSHNNLIINNNMIGEYNFNAHFGVYGEYANFNKIENNSFWHHNGMGIYLYHSNDNEVQNNTCNETSAFSLESSDRNRLHNNYFQNCGGEITIRNSYNNRIINNTMVNSSNLYNIDFARSTNLIIENNNMELGIRIFGDVVQQWNSHIIDLSNTVQNEPVLYLKNSTNVDVQNTYGQVILANCTNITVINHTFSQCGPGLLLGFTTHSNINNNSFTNCGYGISARCYSDYNYFKDNYFFENYKGLSIEYWSNYSVIHNNTCINNSIGIDLYDEACYHKVENNTVIGNIQRGIKVYWECIENKISFNFIDGSYYGMHLSYIENSEILHNTISNCNDGMYCASRVENNIISNNLIFNSEGRAIYLQSASDFNTLRKNTLYHNGFGIRIATSDYNKIYGNNFLYNDIQAYDVDDSYPNDWDNGYPAGGNYWSDYNGIDLNSTPAQNVPPPDGIGDTPYPIDIITKDNYPLMTPFELPFFVYNFDLSVGWNLISLPLIQLNDWVDSVLSSIEGKWDCIRAYDPINDIWLSNVTSRPDSLNNLKLLNNKIGFWINITEPNVTMSVYGDEPTSTTIALYAGWNLVGYPTLTNETVANALWGTGVDQVLICDTSEPYHIREVDSTYLMKPGEGYWIHVPADTVWIIDW